MKNYSIDGVSSIVELGPGNVKLKSVSSDTISILKNDLSGNAKLKIANAVDADDAITLSQLDTRETQINQTTDTKINNSLQSVVVNIPDAQTTQIPLSLLTDNTKLEIEYGFSDDINDKIETGNFSIMFDQANALKLNHVIENQGNLAPINTVVINAYENGTNLGIEVVNGMGQAFDFSYKIKSKLNLSFIVNPPPIIGGFSALYKDPAVVLSNNSLSTSYETSYFSNSTGRYGFLDAPLNIQGGGKFYIEFTINEISYALGMIFGGQFRNVIFPVSDGYFSAGPAENTATCFKTTDVDTGENLVYLSSGDRPYFGGIQVANGSQVIPAFTQIGDVVSLYFDLDLKEVYIRVNGLLGTGAVGGVNAGLASNGWSILTLSQQYSQFWIGNKVAWTGGGAFPLVTINQNPQFPEAGFTYLA